MPQRAPAADRIHRLARLALGALLAACAPADRDASDDTTSGPPAASDSVIVTDLAGRTVRLPEPASRVVALLPSANDALLAMGAGAAIVARTSYDEDPRLADRPSVGGGLDPSIETLLALRPDMVITWNGGAHDVLRTRLATAGIQTFSIGTQDTTALLIGIQRLGLLTGHTVAADSLARSLSADFAAVAASVAGRAPVRVMYALSTDPPMTAGRGTFIDELIGVAGGENIFADLNGFPAVGLEEVVRRDPDALLIPVAPGNERARLAQLRALPGWRELRAVRDGRVVMVSSALLDRPGPTSGEAVRRIRDGLHPAVPAAAGR